VLFASTYGTHGPRTPARRTQRGHDSKGQVRVDSGAFGDSGGKRGSRARSRRAWRPVQSLWTRSQQAAPSGNLAMGHFLATMRGRGYIARVYLIGLPLLRQIRQHPDHVKPIYTLDYPSLYSRAPYPGLLTLSCVTLHLPVFVLTWQIRSIYLPRPSCSLDYSLSLSKLLS
jgi:hypothetical protein